MTSDKKREVGERIRAARAEKGWKQKHLAAEVEVEPITVSRWERGATTPDLNVLTLVAEATGKPLSYFVDAASADPAAAATATASASLDATAERIEAAAQRIADESARLADVLSELRAELAHGRGK